MCQKHKFQQSDGANPCACGTSGTSPAEQALVPEASRDTSSGTLGRKILSPFGVLPTIYSMMNPELKPLFTEFVKVINEGNLLWLLLFLLLFNLPGIIAWIIQLTNQRAVTSVWRLRCDDKDKEIERLAKSVKDLQNKLLKSQRP